MPIGEDEIRNRFSPHPSTDETAFQHAQIREGVIAFAMFLDTVLPDGRAKSVAFTNLQQTSMWCNFAVAEQNPLEPKLKTEAAFVQSLIGKESSSS